MSSLERRAILPMNPDRLTISQVVAHVGIGRSTLFRWLRDDKVQKPDRDVRGSCCRPRGALLGQR
ncbi:MAG: helix-turn-helix domain-containing protein [Planctomycetota bacterium]